MPEYEQYADIRKSFHLFDALRSSLVTVTITLNGERFELDSPMSVTALLAKLDLDPRRVAVEHNLNIIKRQTYPDILIGEGDTVEIVNFVAEAGKSEQFGASRSSWDSEVGVGSRLTDSHSPFVIAGRTFTSRLIVGTGKYPSHAVMAQAHAASGAEMVTVAVRRVNISDRSKESLLDYIDANASSSCRTPPAATRPTTRFARRGWDAKPACRIG